MKVIIAGSRSIIDYDLVSRCIREFPKPIDEIVSGGARGVDTLAIRYARENNIPFKIFKANWGTWGNMAGIKRNGQMAKYATKQGGLLAIWDGHSNGTWSMIQIAQGMEMFTVIKQARKD